MKQFFAHHDEWECYKNGMYSCQRPTLEKVNECADVLGNPDKFQELCEKVINDWPISSRVHLSNKEINRRAYLGRAACCIKVGANEDTVGITWNLLKKHEQDAANNIAQNIINSWETNYSSSKQIKLF